MLTDGDIPPVRIYGNFVVGPTHSPAPEMIGQADVAKGTIHIILIIASDMGVTAVELLGSMLRPRAW
jgi:hypothetical protein